MTPTAAKLIDELIEREGDGEGKAQSGDRGGATRWGVTERVAREFGYKGPMSELPRSLAVSIFEAIYWIEPHFDWVAAVSERIAVELFDTGVNMSQETAARALQRALNALNNEAKLYDDVPVDGRIGPGTLAALKAFLRARSSEGETVMLRALNCLQGYRYIEISERTPTQERFLYGWLRARVQM